MLKSLRRPSDSLGRLGASDWQPGLYSPRADWPIESRGGEKKKEREFFSEQWRPSFSSSRSNLLFSSSQFVPHAPPFLLSSLPLPSPPPLNLPLSCTQSDSDGHPVVESGSDFPSFFPLSFPPFGHGSHTRLIEARANARGMRINIYPPPSPQPNPTCHEWFGSARRETLKI